MFLASLHTSKIELNLLSVRVCACVCERLRADLCSALNLMEQHSADWPLGASADVT